MFRGLSEVKLISLLFSIYYIYTLLVGFTIQFFVLPVLFPNTHWGHGLLVNGDWIQFHTEAVELAKKIAKEGWSVWSLQPEPSHQSMSGITAFFYALTGIYEPWVMLFYNAFLHATSGVLLYFIYREFEISERLSLIFSAIFIIAPTSLTWTTQIHKDGLYIAGILLTMLAIVYSFKNSIKKNIMSVVLGFIGGVLFWIVGRGYALEIAYYFYMLFLGIILVTFIVNIALKIGNYITYLRSFVVLLLVFILIYTLKPQPQTQTQTQTTWEYTWFLPRSVDEQFKRLSEWR
ncbi:hypothetical protein, partial [Caldisericum exile]|uniref:hypothetical protein n=1 Tax=Caldisericum exile TaxID=693075 RepID=UPI003C772EF7